MHLGGVEAHAPLLTISPDGQLLYKIVSVENLLRSSSVTTFTLTASIAIQTSQAQTRTMDGSCPKTSSAE